MNAKKLSIFFGVLAVLIISLVVLNYLKPDTIYGKPSDKLYPATRELLNDPHYNNIIIPDKLNEKLTNKESFFVYYFASDCPHCRVTTPELKPLADELGVNLHQFNLREFTPYFGKMNIEATPTLVYYKDGLEADRMVGGLRGSNNTQGFSIEDFDAFFKKYKVEGND